MQEKKLPMILGIKNCDAVRKATKWLEAQGIEHHVHDYKKMGVDVAVLEEAFAQHGWDNVINRRSTTWRKLDDSVKEAMDEKSAVAIAQDNPSIVKRPMLKVGANIALGFEEEAYKELLSV